MELFARLVEEFGRRLGMEGLAPDGNGRVELRFEGRGRLMLETRDDIAYVTLARAWPEPGEKAARTAADLCHWSRNHPWTIHPGRGDGDLLAFTATVPVAELDLPVLEKMVGYLLDMAASLD